MHVSLRLFSFGVALAGCAGGAHVDAQSPVVPPAAPTSAAPAVPILAPTVELTAPATAVAAGNAVPFDGIPEGLVWPALEKVVAGHDAPIAVVQAARGVPVHEVMRAVWTLRRTDVRLQVADDTGTLRAVDLKISRGAPAKDTCHLAVFRHADGSLRIASPGGPQDIPAAKGIDAFVAALSAANHECAIRYVGFGAESSAMPIGPVFDVMLAVDRAKAAGDARYVLADPIKPPPAK